ncbi:hypothetical protein AA0488_2814 [Kozakia baliensis NRIC 0488]|nr:hypothetical protein AA0488_2814 [Kozakia baliensis NRIC 0488]GEL65140.1 hypothetical protein KBA01_24260 [Kozakia baliensis]
MKGVACPQKIGVDVIRATIETADRQQAQASQDVLKIFCDIAARNIRHHHGGDDLKRRRRLQTPEGLSGPRMQDAENLDGREAAFGKDREGAIGQKSVDQMFPKGAERLARLCEHRLQQNRMRMAREGENLRLAQLRHPDQHRFTVDRGPGWGL